MPYTDLLRTTVFLTGAEATALGAITALAAGRDSDTTTVLVAAAWWLIALVLGMYLGRPARAADGVHDALARARTATSLPEDAPGRIVARRLWPIGTRTRSTAARCAPGSSAHSSRRCPTQGPPSCASTSAASRAVRAPTTRATPSCST